MTPHPILRLQRRMPLCAHAALMLLLPASLFAQAQTGSTDKAAGHPQMTRTERADALQTAPITFLPLHNATQPNDGNELLTGLRLMLDPSVKLYLVTDQNMIMMRGLPDDVALAHTILAELDRPRKSFHLSLTLTELNGKERGTPRHIALDVSSNQRIVVKQGSKIPVITGASEPETSHETQMTYLDIGLNVDVTVAEVAAGGQLKYKVESSALSPDVAAAGIKDPVIRQTIIEGATTIPSRKQVVLGTLNMPGGTQQLELAAMVEPE